MIRAVSIWREALDDDRRRARVDRSQDEREFLPAALEVLETPASPVGRLSALLICSLFCLVLVWSWFGRIDTVAVAHGQVVPSGRVKRIQPLEVGVVREIHVREGQRVRAGHPLVDLDPTDSEVNLDQTRKVLEMSRMEYAQADYGLRHLTGERNALLRPEGVGEAVFEATARAAGERSQSARSPSRGARQRGANG